MYVKVARGDMRVDPVKGPIYPPDKIKDLINKVDGQRLRIRELNEYYDNEKQMIVDSNVKNPQKIRTPLASYITDTIASYFMGKPPVITAKTGKSTEKENSDTASIDEQTKADMIAAIQGIEDYNDIDDHNHELSTDQSITGEAYELLFVDTKDIDRVRYAVISDHQVIIAYDKALELEPLFAIRFYKIDDKKHRVDYYNEVGVITYQGELGSLEEVEYNPHYFGIVPIVEYVNNSRRFGDFEKQTDLIDGYNLVQSNTSNLHKYNDKAILHLDNLSGSDEEDVQNMLSKGYALTENGGNISWLIKSIDDGALENFKDRLVADIHKTSHTPDLTDNNFSGNASGVAMAYKTLGLDWLCAAKERKFKKGLQRRYEALCNYLNFKNSTRFNYLDIEITFRRNLPQNLSELSTIITNLEGIVSTETLLSWINSIEDVPSELARMNEEASNSAQQTIQNSINQGFVDGEE